MRQRLIITLAIVVLLVVSAFSALAGVTNFDSVTLAGDLVVGDDATIADDTVINGDLTVDDVFNIDNTAYALTGTQVLTPVQSFYLLAPSAALTVTLGNAGDTGDMLILLSSVATNTIIADTGATVGGGAITLAENDMAVFLYSGSAWVEVASPDNS